MYVLQIHIHIYSCITGTCTQAFTYDTLSCHGAGWALSGGSTALPKRPWDPLGKRQSIKSRQHNGLTVTMRPAGRLREGTTPSSNQHSLNLAWNNVPGFGPLNRRKMLINLEMLRSLEHRIYEQSSREQEWKREWKSA